MAIAALRAALESERSSLGEIDANIKRIVQTPVPRQNHDRLSGAGERYGGLVGRMSGGGLGAVLSPEVPGKRRHETKTAFSRLSVRHDAESDLEDNSAAGKKPRLSSHVTRDLPSKQEIMAVQCGDEQSKTRNRRMFGSLLGTLHKFRQEELVLRGKEEQRARVERRIEQQAALERETHKRERQTLFAERELKKATIKALEAKVARVTEFELWAESQRALGNFIATSVQPRLRWLPRVMNKCAQHKLDSSRAQHQKYMETKRRELEEELIKIEQKCLRTLRSSQNATKLAKENKMEESNSEMTHKPDDSLCKRDKFPSDARVKQENGATVKREEEDATVCERDRRDSEESNHSVSAEQAAVVEQAGVVARGTSTLEAGDGEDSPGTQPAPENEESKEAAEETESMHENEREAAEESEARAPAAHESGGESDAQDK